MKNTTDEINEWVEKYGSERDALNVALAQLRQAEIEITYAQSEIVKLTEGAEEDLH